jgi:hypothetical protein
MNGKAQEAARRGIRVELPAHLRTLAGVGYELLVSVEGPVTTEKILDGVEAEYPVLEGTLRDHTTRMRRPFIRFFAGGEDWSHVSAQTEVPAAVASGAEVFIILGAIAGG